MCNYLLKVVFVSVCGQRKKKRNGKSEIMRDSEKRAEQWRVSYPKNYSEIFLPESENIRVICGISVVRTDRLLLERVCKNES